MLDLVPAGVVVRLAVRDGAQVPHVQELSKLLEAPHLMYGRIGRGFVLA
jgi:hypothetical protein